MRLAEWWTVAIACALSACGGGGGGESAAPPASNLVVTATGPSNRVASGGQAVLDVVVSNTGPNATTNVVTEFVFYAGARVSAIACTATGGAQCPVTSQQFGSIAPVSTRYTAAIVPPQGELHYQITQVIDAVTSGPVQTSISATADGHGGNAPARADVVVTAYYNQLTAWGGAVAPTVAPGDTATYVMGLSNDGPDSALNLSVTSDLGPRQTAVSTSCVASGGAVCPPTRSNATSWTVPSVPAGGSLIFTMVAAVAADATGLVSNVFSVIDPGDRFPTDNVRIATTVATASSVGSFMTLRSDAGEPLGGGTAYAYTQADAVIAVSSMEAGLLSFSVQGNERWSGTVRLAGTAGNIQPGTYVLASVPPTGGNGFFDWSGGLRSCNNGTQTQLVIDSVAYAGATLSAIDLRFDHACTGASAALHGRLHWTAADATQPSSPVQPPPATLWRAPAASTPASGNYIVLASEAGDPLGKGATTVLTQANAIFSISSAVPGQLNVNVQADDDVYATFRGVFAQSQLLPGYYGPLQSWPTSNPAMGTMDWSQGGLGCNGASGWFVIDDIRYSGMTIASIDARFEQHCESVPAALRGQIHWAPGDATVPPGPLDPPPANLWTPPAGATPTTGNYVYLQSDAGDIVGQGGTYLLTAANASFTATSIGADFKITADGGSSFSGEFVGMNSISELQPGYYAGLHRFPFNNPTKGGMDVGLLLAGCNKSSGWFVVDQVSYSGNALASIELRFEQHCEAAVPALHGKIRWGAG